MNEEEKNLNPVNDEANETKEERVSSEVAAEPETVNEQPAPEVKKKKVGKTPILISIAAVVVIAIVAIVASAATSSPTKLLGKGLANSVSAIQQNETIVFAEKVAKGGSIEAVCDMEELLDLPVEGILSLKLYTAAAKMAVTADVAIEGESVLDASAFMDEENVAVASDVLFGSESYGTNLTNFVDNFNDSVFGPDGELSLGIELPEMANSAVEDAAKMTEDSQKIAKSMLAYLLQSIEEHAAVSKEDESLDFNGTEVKATAVGVQADSEALSAIIADLIEYLRSDAELKAFLYNYADYFAAVLVEADLVYGDYEDGETIIDEFYEQLEDIGDDEMEELAEALEDADVEISLTFYITKSGKELIGVKFDGEADGDKVKASVLAGPSWKNLEEVNVRLDDGYSVIRVTYTVETNDKKEFSAELKVREDSENILVGEFVWDKENGDFEVELSDDWGDTYGLEGSLAVDSKAVTIVLDSISEDSEKIDLGISVIITASDKMPEMPVYTEILDMTSDDVEDLVYDLEEILEELSGILYYY